MSGEEKAAVLLLNLPPVKAETILARMEPERRGRLRAQMQTLKGVSQPPEVIDEVLREFNSILQKGPPVARSPEPPPSLPTPQPQPEKPPETPRPPLKPEEVARLVGQSYARPEPAEGNATEDDAEAVPVGDPLGALKVLSPDRLSLALKDEQPYTVALILHYLDVDQAGEVLKRLPSETRRTVSVQLGKAVTVSLEVVQRIARAILNKSHGLADAPADAEGKGRFKKIADMLRLLEKPDRMEVLTALEEHDVEVAAAIKEHLYHFDDLLAIEDRSMQKLLSEVDSRSLAVAMKGADDAIKEKVLGNLSKRARETLMEEMEFLGSIPSNQIQQAQKTIVDVIQRLDQAGELVMNQ